jgi:hypothetical protein
MVLVATVVSGSLAAAADHVGIVKSLAGDAVIIRGDRTIKAEPNLKLQLGDTISTGPQGKIGLIMEDDTVISLGSNSTIAIKDFVFHPQEKKLSFIAKVFQGTASFLSGQIAKLVPEQARIETPHATIGTRGTHVLVQVD